MTAVKAFRSAVEALDIDAAMECFADDATFHSPVVFKPYQGKDAIAVLLSAVAQVFEDFSYVDELTSGDRAALVFTANAGSRQVTGIDYLTVENDAITDLTVFIRPMSGLTALAETMAALLETASA